MYVNFKEVLCDLHDIVELLHDDETFDLKRVLNSELLTVAKCEDVYFFVSDGIPTVAIANLDKEFIGYEHIPTNLFLCDKWSLLKPIDLGCRNNGIYDVFIKNLKILSEPIDCKKQNNYN